MSLFVSHSKEMVKAVELTKAGKNVPLGLLIDLLISKEAHYTNPHNSVGRELSNTTQEFIQDLDHKRIKEMKVAVTFDKKHIFLHSEESLAKIRALRSTHRREVRLEPRNQI